MSVTSTAFEIVTPEVESSSSIGKNSDEEELGSRTSESDEENDAQSHYSGRLYAMEELEQVLPMRRGISKFYDGKSKSFTSLADASASSSIQEIVKPKNMYARRRRNLLAFNRVWDNGRSSSPRKGNATGGISKRPLESSKNTLALAVAMTQFGELQYSSTSDDSRSSSFSFAPSRHPPPSTSPTKPRIPSAEELSLLDVDHHSSTPRPTCVQRQLPSIALKTGLKEQT